MRRKIRFMVHRGQLTIPIGIVMWIAAFLLLFGPIQSSFTIDETHQDKLVTTMQTDQNLTITGSGTLTLDSCHNFVVYVDGQGKTTSPENPDNLSECEDAEFHLSQVPFEEYVELDNDGELIVVEAHGEFEAHQISNDINLIFVVATFVSALFGLVLAFLLTGLIKNLVLPLI